MQENGKNSTTSESNSSKRDVLEVILENIGGTFKRFQIINYTLFCLTLSISGSFTLSYVFTALNLEYRCFIPECELLNSTTFEPDWLHYAIPYKNSKPSSCNRYTHLSLTTYGTNDTCTENSFDHSSSYRCDEFVYKTNELSILNEFGLECDENVWKLAMVGTASNTGRFIFTPIMGLLSDRYGRRTILIVGVLGSTVFALIRSMTTNYLTFVLFEFLDASIGSCTYSASFLLAMEWIGVKDRVLLGSIVAATYPFGQVFLGMVARAVKDFRLLIRIIYAPGFLVFVYIWIAPESMRWLIVKRKKDQILKVLRRAERINHVKITENTLNLIDVELTENKAIDDSEKAEMCKSSLFRQIIQKRVFVIRFLICAFAWITNAFVSYGISLTSTSLAGDKYINFCVIALAGVPAMLICYFLMEFCGRRWTLFSSLSIGGASIVLSKLLPLDYSVLSIMLFFIGKCFITASFTGLYVYTSELWPTTIRHSMMSLLSTFGRIGAAFSTLAPILSQYIDILPYLLFGGMAVTASILILQLPETLNKKLPDTLSEAENIELSVNENS